MAPLVDDSLMKCLYWYKSDGVLTKKEALSAQISSFLLELPMLPTGVAEKKRKLLIKALKAARVGGINIPTLDVLKKKFWNSYSETCSVDQPFI